MKKNFIVLLSLLTVCLLVLTGCSGGEKNADVQSEEKTVVYEVLSENSFDGVGFTLWNCEKDGEYVVTAEGGESNIVWTVYVLDEEFEDGLRYIPQAYEPALEGSGGLTLKAGQYVYVQCSANSFTADAPVSGGRLTIEG